MIDLVFLHTELPTLLTVHISSPRYCRSSHVSTGQNYSSRNIDVLNLKHHGHHTGSSAGGKKIVKTRKILAAWQAEWQELFCFWLMVSIADEFLKSLGAWRTGIKSWKESSYHVSCEKARDADDPVKINSVDQSARSKKLWQLWIRTLPMSRTPWWAWAVVTHLSSPPLLLNPRLIKQFT